MVLAEDLRQAVLQTALQGKLTEQLETDSDVDEMLISIRKEKEKLIADKKIKKEKPLPEIQDEEIPFDIPDNWCWEKVGNICDCGAGATPTRGNKVFYENGTIFWLKTGELTDGYIYKCQEKVTQVALEKCSLRLNKEGDILIAMYGATIGKLGIVTFPLTTNQACCGCTPYTGVYNLYMFYYFMSVKKRLIDKAEGGAQPNISREKIRNSLIPLPPIEEQHRIVDKINEIMPKIDEYEKIEKELEALKKEFPSDMKDALLQAAMQGKLTEQLESDSSVDKLLVAIKEEKKELISKKKIKKEKPLPDIEEEEIPFDIPKNWRWVRLKNIVYSGGQKKPDKCFSYIDIGSIDNIHQKLDNEDNIIEANKAPSRARKIVNYGDVLYATVRPYLHNMCIIDREFKAEPIASTGFAVMTCYKGVLNRFLLLYMLSPEFDRYANSTENAKGMAYPAINDNKLYRALIPLPPIEEQQRIVERLDALLPLCEDLKE